MSDLFMNISSDDWNKLKYLVDLSAENARLKAEVERLTNCKSEADRLKAEVERLRKAGDELADKAKLAGCNECFGMFNALEDALDAWNAAKEGKPSV